jgi:hypothetical protein
MLEMHFLTWIKFSHLLVLAIALGGALTADYIIVRRAILAPITRSNIELVKFLAGLVAVGLLGLWATGVVLALETQSQNPLFYTNQKFWAKVFIVVVLTVNAFVIHGIVLPKLERQEGRKLFDGLSFLETLTLCVVGGISFTSWMYPTILGLARELSFKTPGVEILASYYVVLLGAILANYTLAMLSLKNHAWLYSLFPRLGPDFKTWP